MVPVLLLLKGEFFGTLRTSPSAASVLVLHGCVHAQSSTHVLDWPANMHTA
jgi:hypothetical protein